MWLSDEPLAVAQPIAPVSASDPAPMPTIAEEEGSPDRPSPPAPLSPDSTAPFTHDDVTDQKASNSAAAEEADVSSSFAFRLPALRRHRDSPIESKAGADNDAADEGTVASGGTSIAGTDQTTRARATGDEDGESWSAGQEAATQAGPLSAATFSLRVPRSADAPAAGGLMGSWEGLEHVGLGPLPSGGTSPDTAAGSQSRFGLSHSGRSAADDSLDGHRMPRLVFPGFSAMGEQPCDPELTSSTPKFSPKTHFLEHSNAHLDGEHGKMPSGSGLAPQRLRVDTSLSTLPDHARQHVVGASGRGVQEMQRDANRYTGTEAEGGGAVDISPISSSSPVGRNGLQTRRDDGGGIDNGPISSSSPVGRSSLEVRRESMLRALSGGSSRSSSGGLPPSPTPPALPLMQQQGNEGTSQHRSSRSVPSGDQHGNEVTSQGGAHQHVQGQEQKPTKQVAGSLLQQLPKQLQAGRGPSARHAAESGKSNPSRPASVETAGASLKNAPPQTARGRRAAAAAVPNPAGES